MGIRNRNRSANRAKLLKPEGRPIDQPAMREIPLTAAEAEGCRAIWQERQRLEGRLREIVSSVLAAHQVPQGLEVKLDFVKGILYTPVTPAAPAPTSTFNSAGPVPPLTVDTPARTLTSMQEPRPEIEEAKKRAHAFPQ